MLKHRRYQNKTCVHHKHVADLRVGSFSGLTSRLRHVRFALESGLKAEIVGCLLSAISGHRARNPHVRFPALNIRSNDPNIEAAWRMKLLVRILVF
jgi:hypothetical protein